MYIYILERIHDVFQLMHQMKLHMKFNQIHAFIRSCIYETIQILYFLIIYTS